MKKLDSHKQWKSGRKGEQQKALESSCSVNIYRIIPTQLRDRQLFSFDVTATLTTLFSEPSTETTKIFGVYVCKQHEFRFYICPILIMSEEINIHKNKHAHYFRKNKAQKSIHKFISKHSSSFVSPTPPVCCSNELGKLHFVMLAC